MSSDCFYCGHIPHGAECPTIAIMLLTHDKSECKEEVVRLRAEVKLLNNKIDACVEEIDDLDAENAKLREVLKSIADGDSSRHDVGSIMSFARRALHGF